MIGPLSRCSNRAAAGGKLNGFDSVILFGNVLAGLLAPTLFLHFCLTFPAARPWLSSKARVALLYLPVGLIMSGLAFAANELAQRASSRAHRPGRQTSNR